MMVGTDSSHMGRDIDCVSHTYTQLSREESQRTPPVYMSSIDSWRTRFPSVADLIDTDDATGHNLQNTCTMLHIHSTISTSSVEAPPQSLMCTKLEVSLPDGELLDCQWDCVTRIYAAGKKIPVWELPHTPLRLSEDPATGSRSLKLPFASDFWRAFYNRLSQAAGNSDEENNAIKGVTVVQELFSTSILGDKNRSTLLMWDFSKAAPGAPGKAVWKEVLRNPTNLLSVDSNAEASGTTWTIAQPARLPMSPSPYDDLTYFRYDEQAYPGTPMHVPTISLDNTGYYHDSQDGCFEAYTGFEQYRGGLQFGHGSSY